jgi:hypothetical protein
VSQSGAVQLAVYEILCQEREKAATLYQLRDLALPRLTFSWEEEGCRKCGQPLRVRLTRRRTVATVRYGKLIAIERQGHCPNHEQLPPARSKELPQLVAPGCNIGYDLIAWTGLERYGKCRQHEEIQTELSRQTGMEIPVRTISESCHKFVAYVQAVHQESIPLLRREMRDRGGYILHIDGTCEEGSRVLLVCLDSISGQVLESRKISSENAEEVEQVLRQVRRDWGRPLAVVHDLRKSLITAAGNVFPGVAQFVCHFHFAADVGKDILSPHVDRLRNLFRRTKVRPKLRALCRSLKKFAAAEESSEHMLGSILDGRSSQQLRELSTPEAVQGTVHALASWILAFSHNGEGSRWFVRRGMSDRDETFGQVLGLPLRPRVEKAGEKDRGSPDEQSGGKPLSNDQATVSPAARSGAHPSRHRRHVRSRTVGAKS